MGAVIISIFLGDQLEEVIADYLLAADEDSEDPAHQIGRLPVEFGPRSHPGRSQGRR